MREPVGTVQQVGFAALKGSRYIARESVFFDAAGPVGDREWCLVDPAARKVVRTISEPLLGVRVLSETHADGAHTTGEAHPAEGAHLDVEMADGTRASGMVQPAGGPLDVDYWSRRIRVVPHDGAPARLLTDQFDRPVVLARAERGDAVYGAPVSLMGTASLQDLAGRLGRDEPFAQPERFRSTLVVNTQEPWIEDTWAGHDLHVGEVVLRIGGGIGRCAIPNLDPASAERDVPILKELAGYRPVSPTREPLLGVYAQVVGTGTVRPGDPVRLGDSVQTGESDGLGDSVQS